MGGRGTYAIGDQVSYHWKTVGKIAGVKVLALIDKGPHSRAKEKLPEEAHHSQSYILLDQNGTFPQYREYNENHELVFEIGYHREKKVSPGPDPVLHAHEYDPPGNFKDRGKARRLTDAEYAKYKKFFKGVPKDAR